MTDRYELRSSSQTDTFAIVDVIAKTVDDQHIYPPDQLDEAREMCAYLNRMDRQFQASEHTAASFARQWRHVTV